jgi:hypothetical protein
MIAPTRRARQAIVQNLTEVNDDRPYIEVELGAIVRRAKFLSRGNHENRTA